ncbi:serine/threonine-protein kinase cot-1 [Capsaspora owczarzaki ATCC 30864]|uniref:non-specific serine/threonine protein kinase n=1 Tax=Capsaspora owczarzaki (strain ATCC 30864) TaxID=595528 RepID=A0A0D2X3R1_CAPO3|nr:serine/threonine-protein kinase cot-1 [Capsaspora owczarzaki ATCC 30864]KJE94749.1 AGC/NDR/NDR-UNCLASSIFIED protein kinase [Capsaspora owczarzaki ATCC 30864]|eukprot:XP_004347023.1 serine/threonine-protein kinase cot-1 [Capsaspora owczarzaki ATCC 30864]
MSKPLAPTKRLSPTTSHESSVLNVAAMLASTHIDDGTASAVSSKQQQATMRVLHKERGAENEPTASSTKLKPSSDRAGDTTYQDDEDNYDDAFCMDDDDEDADAHAEALHQQVAARLQANLASVANTSNAVAAAPARRRVKVSTADMCTAANVYFLDYYRDLFTYLAKRKQRTDTLKSFIASGKMPRAQIESETARHRSKESDFLRKRRTRMHLGDFQVYAQIGQGGYGSVFLAQKKDTAEICAVKKMRKDVLIARDEVHHIRNERNVLAATNSPWLIKLLYSFQDRSDIYFVMEYIPGGDMRTLLTQSGILRHEHARFYIMEVLMCVSSLHQLGFIHRDLKPENFLVDSSGHLKLTDFGLAKGTLSEAHISNMREKLEAAQKYAETHELATLHLTAKEKRAMYQSVRSEDRSKAYSIVGSPDYMPPEMLKGESYDLLVDYWAIGCMLFEFLAGYPPFAARTLEEVWANIYKWEQTLQRPIYTGVDEEFNLTDNAWSFITKLLCGHQVRWSRPSQIKVHPFFENSDWDSLRESTPPFTPELKDKLDVSYFDKFDPADIDTTTPSSASPSEGEAHLFAGVTFKGRKGKHFDVPAPSSFASS